MKFLFCFSFYIIFLEISIVPSRFLIFCQSTFLLMSRRFFYAFVYLVGPIGVGLIAVKSERKIGNKF